jgi:type I restriction enzyme, S subunit
MTFPTYPHYKDSGVEWIKTIPATWNVSRIKNTTYLKGRVGWKGLTSDEFLDHGYSYLVTGTDFKNKYIDWTSCYSVDKERFEDDPFIQLQNDDLLITKDGTIGKLAIVKELNGYACLNSGIFLVRPLNTYLAEYMYWVLSSNSFRVFCDLLSQGSTIQHLYQNVFEKFLFPSPPKNEQKKIINFLDRETAKIDALIQEQEKLIELLKEKRQAVISDAVCRGLDPNVPMKDSGVEWLGMVPKHWALTSLTRLIGPVVDYRGRTPIKTDDGIFLVTAKNIRNGKINYEISKEYADPESVSSLLARGKPEIGDVLFTMEAPLGQVALVDRTDIGLAQRIVKFRGLPNLMLGNYLIYWIMGDYCQARLQTLATGSTALGIKASKLGQIECLCPPLSEQKKIVSNIEKQISAIDKLLTESEKSIEFLNERRTALISAAVTGQIDVREFA